MHFVIRDTSFGIPHAARLKFLRKGEEEAKRFPQEQRHSTPNESMYHGNHLSFFAQVKLRYPSGDSSSHELKSLALIKVRKVPLGFLVL